MALRPANGAPHRRDNRQTPSSCEGTAGSFYCTFKAGSHELIIRMGDVELPRKVIEVNYTA